MVVVEGIAGSGKSTLAGFVGDLLGARGIAHRVVLEGDLDHPADYESVAWLAAGPLADLLAAHPGDADLIRANARAYEGGFLVPYGALGRAGRIGPEALASLGRHDVYELDEATYRRLSLRRWQAFAEHALTRPDVWVFECCLLQNPITTLMMKHNTPPAVIQGHLRAVADAIAPLAPVVVHLRQDDVRATLEHVIAERPGAWTDFFISYHTDQAYGRAHGLEGLDGTVDALLARRRLEEELLDDLPLESLRIDTTAGWAGAREVLRRRFAETSV